MQEKDPLSGSGQKISRFRSADLQHYIKKYRLTRPLTEMEASLLAEQTGLDVQRAGRRSPGFRPVSWQSLLLKSLGLALLLVLVLMIPLLMP